jgi:DNA adenine methylase
MGRYKTPLRYPGGKQKLTPFIKEVLATNKLQGVDYVEVYAGGAGLAIELLIGGEADRIHLNDKCYAVYSFWRSIVDNADEFCRRIRSASLTIKEWRRQREIFVRQTEFEMIDVGFSTFYLNRCNRSGILSAGAIGGINQTGEWKIDARFPRNELIKRVEAIASRSAAISVTNWDAGDYLSRYVPKLSRRTLVYCDPPYFQKAERLYMHHYQPDDHQQIAEIIQRLKVPWIVSYDNAPQIKRWYHGHKQIEYGLQYNAARAYVGIEVLFFSPKLRLPLGSAIRGIDSALRKRRTASAKRA